MNSPSKIVVIGLLLACHSSAGDRTGPDVAGRIDARAADGSERDGSTAGKAGAEAGQVGDAGTGAGGVAGTGGVITGGTGTGAAGSAGSGGVVDAGAADGRLGADAVAGGDAGTSTGGAGIGGTGGRSDTGGTGGALNLPGGVVAMFPAPGASGICPDPVLRITFDQVPALGSSGKIQIHNAAGTVVTSVDMAASTVTDTIASTTLTLNRPVYVEGKSAVIYLKTKALSYGQTYSVTVDAGAIRPASGSFSISGSTAWRFATAAAAPNKTTALTVALDGSGDFCTVQGAADAVPANNTAPTVITIKDGTYHEVVRIKSKHAITLHGQSRKGVIIRGVNNNNLNAGTSARPLVAINNANDVVIENLTIRNDTPQGGSQAEALALGSCDRCIVRDADIISLQDTLLWSKRIYAKNCFISGNVDYIWGSGTAYFDQCEIHTAGRAGYLVQARNDASAYGYVFVDCKLTADAGVTGDKLARVDASVYPASHVAYVNCQMGGHIAPEGWTITGSAASSLRFWEYQSKDASGRLIDVSRRVSGSKQISADQAAAMRDAKTVLGGWDPTP